MFPGKPHQRSSDSLRPLLESYAVPLTLTLFNTETVLRGAWRLSAPHRRHLFRSIHPPSIVTLEPVMGNNLRFLTHLGRRPSIRFTT